MKSWWARCGCEFFLFCARDLARWLIAGDIVNRLRLNSDAYLQVKVLLRLRHRLEGNLQSCTMHDSLRRWWSNFWQIDSLTLQAMQPLSDLKPNNSHCGGWQSCNSKCTAALLSNVELNKWLACSLFPISQANVCQISMCKRHPLWRAPSHLAE